MTAPDSRASAQGGDEFALIDRIAQRLADPSEFAGLRQAGDGELFSGDDAAVLSPIEGDLLFATDLVVEGVHFDRRFGSLADAGWKAVSVNVSDIAAMGGVPLHIVVGLAAPLGTDVDELTTGLGQAAASYRIGLVGGDMTASDTLVISVAVTGACPRGKAVLRGGARAGDEIYVTGPLGRSAAGLELLRRPAGATGTHAEDSPPRAAGPRAELGTSDGVTSGLIEAYLRPVARVNEGQLAAKLGATAMIDLSDGIGRDLGHVARRSGIGLRLTSIPVAEGASLEQALGGGEDYELAFTVPPGREILQEFVAAGLGQPIRVGECSEDVAERSLDGAPLPASGWAHSFS